MSNRFSDIAEGTTKNVLQTHHKKAADGLFVACGALSNI
jgi:hypothetical protein